MNFILSKREIENVKDYLKQQATIKNHHDGKTNHRGINECCLALSRNYYWPNMKEITKFINVCAICGQAKYDRNLVRPRFEFVPPPRKHLEVVHLDLLSIVKTPYNNRCVLKICSSIFSERCYSY